MRVGSNRSGDDRPVGDYGFAVLGERQVAKIVAVPVPYGAHAKMGKIAIEQRGVDGDRSASAALSSADGRIVVISRHRPYLFDAGADGDVAAGTQVSAADSGGVIVFRPAVVARPLGRGFLYRAAGYGDVAARGIVTAADSGGVLSTPGDDFSASDGYVPACGPVRGADASGEFPALRDYVAALDDDAAAVFPIPRALIDAADARATADIFVVVGSAAAGHAETDIVATLDCKRLARRNVDAGIVSGESRNMVRLAFEDDRGVA